MNLLTSIASLRIFALSRCLWPVRLAQVKLNSLKNSSGFLKTARHRVVRIDADELRDRMPGYTGHNSNLFHGAVSLIVEKIHGLVLSKNQTFILDGTFSKYEKAADNIRRSLDKNRTIFIFYIYQTPRTAWRLTQAREILEIVKIVDPNALIDSYIGEHYTREELEKLL